MENKHHFVGIDLGTTNSAIAYIRNGKPEIIVSEAGERILPSVVLIDLQEKVIVGENARTSLVAMPDRGMAAVKRKMGSAEALPLAEHTFLPQEISAMILKELKRYADRELGEGVKEAIITVPAYFTDAQRRATKEAGELAGFVVERIINEPTAAALVYGLGNLSAAQHILVYDLGGGTFDVSVVEMIDGLLEVKASAGNSHLGGEDFDWHLVDWFAGQVIAQHGVDPRLDLRAKTLLKEEAEKVKKLLSNQDFVHVHLPLLIVKENKPIGLSLKVLRSQFLQQIEHHLDETFRTIDHVLQEAQLSVNEIDEVLLVGGSTRIPRIHEMISQKFNKKARADVHPDEAVALGAAVQAGLKSGELQASGLVVTDVAPFSLGVAVLKGWGGFTGRPGGFAPIITRNTTIPVTKSETFYTCHDEQRQVMIEVYQGEQEWCEYNYLLGKFLLDGIPPHKSERESVEVTFAYNLNGILEVTAKLVSTGKAMHVSLQDGLDRASAEVFAKSLQRLEQLCSQEDDLAEDWNRLEGELAAFEVDEEIVEEEMEKLLQQAASYLDELPQEVRDRLEKVIASTREAWRKGDQEKLNRLKNELTDLLIDFEITV
jgi:molecular chaperone DnaK